MSAPVSPLKHSSEAASLGAQIAKAVAWVSGIFSLVVCISLIMAQIQIMAADPLNDPNLKAMRAQVAKDPKNQQLRKSVQSLLYLSQRAFFANQQQQRATGLLLLFGTAVFLASMKTYVELRLKLPVPLGQAPREGGTAERSAGRWAVTAGAGLVVLATLLMVFLSPPPIDLDAKAEDATAGTNPAAAAPEAGKPGEASPSSAGKGTEAPAAAPGKFEPPPLHAWPMFRGPFGLGVAGHTDAPLEWDGKSKKNIKWVVPIPKAGNSSPIVWDKMVFVTGGDAEGRAVYAFDTETGKLAWEGKVGSTGDGGLKKLMAEVGYCSPTMATDGERVFAIVATGEINAFTMDGKPAWPGNLGSPKIDYGYGSSLAVIPGRVLVQVDTTQSNGRLVALDAKSGKKIWDKPRAGVSMSWASPAIAIVNSKPQLLLVGNPFLMGHDPLTGEALWRANWMGESSGEVAPSVACANGIAYVVTAQVALVAVKPGEEKPLWKYDQEGLPDVSSPVATDKFVLMAASGGLVTCIDAVKGNKLWTHEFDDGFESSPVIVGDRVYLMDKKGTTYVLKLSDKYEPLATNPLGEDSGCTPAFPQGRIYIRTKKNLYCIGKD